MIYYLSVFCKKLTPAKALSIINSKNLHNSKINLLLKKSGVRIKGESHFKMPLFFEFGNLSLGNNVFINSGCVLLDNEMISIGENTLIGPNVTLTTASHDVSPERRHSVFMNAPIHIGKNVWLAAGVVVLPGVSIGDNSVIAANSVVRYNVPPNCLFAGAPAVFKKNI